MSFLKRIYRNNTSGETGVSLINIRNFKYWRSAWTENGKQKQKTFSVSTFGSERARQLAIEYRKQKIESLKDLYVD